MLLNDYSKTQLMCAFCENLVNADDKMCIACNEYKGVMSVADFQKYFGGEF